MTVNLALAAAATLISLAFALSTLERWLARRRRHEAAWTVALSMFAAGSLAFGAGEALGWSEWSFRAFYLFGGILNVPFLALGAVYLLAGQRTGDRWAVGLALAGAFATGILVAAPVVGPIDPGRLPDGSTVFGVLPRALAAVASGVAALVIVAGALWSALRLLTGHARPGAVASPVAPGRLAAANVLIALGTLTISAKGIFEPLGGDDGTAFAAALVTGITIIFAGFLLTTATTPARRQVATRVPEPAASFSQFRSPS